MLLLLLALGCSGDEPVVSGVPQPTTAEAVREEREEREARASPKYVEASYQKPEGVLIDVRYLGGRDYQAVRGEVAEQLGGLVESVELPEGQGKELRFERATVRVVDGAIYMFDVALDPPVRRDQALVKLGFPDSIPKEYTVLPREFRATHVWGFRRLRFFRVEQGSELIERVQAWKRDLADN